MQKLLMLTGLLLCSLCQFSWAQENSVEGIWTTFDEESGKADSLVKIWIEQGELKGKIIKLIEPDEENPKCSECEDEFKDMPILGMQFIWGLTEDDGVWDDGNILDPGNGSIYTSKIEVIENGTKLDVRGYIGFAFAGRSTVWERASDELIKAL
ncbi:MAG: DUF2147 domain-containing protein [Bermanella sp.]